MFIDTFQIEKALLIGKGSSQLGDVPAALMQLANDVVNGSFRNALTSPAARSLLQADPTAFSRPLGDLLSLQVPENGTRIEHELLRLILAVACLHAFVQVNWTGPDLDVQPLDVLSIDVVASPHITEELINSKAISELAYGGEPAYHLTKVAVFLRLAQVLLDTPYEHCASVSWWRLRTTFIHQQVLDEPAALPTTILTSLEQLPIVYTSEPELAGRLRLEQGLLEHQIAQDKSAGEYFVHAARATGLRYELTGALGKRTKFQQTELSQLVLLAESQLTIDDDKTKQGQPTKGDSTTELENGSTSVQSGAPEERKLPETLVLNDDTLLEHTEFTKNATSDTIGTPQSNPLSHIDPSAQPALHPLDQSILLALCLNVKNTSPSHGLTTEQMTPYVARVISHPRNWSVHTMALLLRSRLESHRSRTVERATLQLQALIDQMPTTDSTLPERLLYFHSIPLPSKWEMERELAKRFMSLGVIRSALEIFERLEMWEDVVKCWGSLERPEKGIAIVRDLLEGRKAEAETVVARGKAELAAAGSGDRTPATGEQKAVLDSAREAKLWCLLGDLEPQKGAEHYNRAWEVSRGTSGRAMRSLGGYHFARGEYGEAISCLNRAVAINPLLSRSWFIMGCACMRLEDWEGGMHAFSRCVAIDEEDGESWNNLASMYLRMGTVEKKDKTGEEGDSGDLPKNAETKSKEGSSETMSLSYGQDVAKSIPFSNKRLAFRALKQGLKYSYDNWRMWYNYMIVAMDVGELFEASRALGRVVEGSSEKVGAQSVDEDVLERLVGAATRRSTDPDDAKVVSAGGVSGDGGDGAQPKPAVNPNEGLGLYRNLRSLFDRTILPRVSTPRIFRAYARLLTSQSDWEGTIKAYLDGYRCSTAGTMEKGEADVNKWREAVNEVEEIVDVLRNFGPRVEGYKWKFQGRSIVRTFIGRSRDFEEEPEWSALMELQNELRKDED